MIFGTYPVRIFMGGTSRFQPWRVKSCDRFLLSMQSRPMCFRGVKEILSELRGSKKMERPPEGWKKFRDRLRGGDKQWKPHKRLTWEQMDRLRTLRSSDPELWGIKKLAWSFKVSPQAVSRILRSKWQPSEDRAKEQDLASIAKRAGRNYSHRSGTQSWVARGRQLGLKGAKLKEYVEIHSKDEIDIPQKVVIGWVERAKRMDLTNRQTMKYITEKMEAYHEEHQQGQGHALTDEDDDWDVGEERYERTGRLLTNTSSLSEHDVRSDKSEEPVARHDCHKERTCKTEKQSRDSGTDKTKQGLPDKELDEEEADALYIIRPQDSKKD